MKRSQVQFLALTQLKKYLYLSIIKQFIVKNLLLIICILFTSLTFADCVWGAKDKDTYRVIDTGYGAKILFSGGYTNDFIIKIDGSIYSKNLDEVYFIKDDFCDWESDVLVIDGEVFGVQSVTDID